MESGDLALRLAADQTALASNPYTSRPGFPTLKRATRGGDNVSDRIWQPGLPGAARGGGRVLVLCAEQARPEQDAAAGGNLGFDFCRRRRRRGSLGRYSPDRDAAAACCGRGWPGRGAARAGRALLPDVDDQ